MRIFSLICANGLGHFRRSVSILDRWMAMDPHLDVTVACSGWQLERTTGWAPRQRLESRGRFITGGIEPGVTWSLDPRAYDGGSLMDWERWLDTQPALGAADMVLSDNLAGVLGRRPDAVLVGSFLWSDVLEAAYPDHLPVARFVAHERALLAAHRPPMLCAGPMVMRGVIERARAVELPFMCEGTSLSKSPAGRPRIAVLGGATGAADGLLNDIRAAIAEAAPACGWMLIERFGFEPEDYRGASLVVCRPGLGTVTACVEQSVPMVAVYEPGNVELAHNAQRIEQLGIGFDLGVDPSPARVIDAANRALENDPLRFGAAFDRLARDGLQAAADWLKLRALSPSRTSSDFMSRKL